jgi:uncharacterized protein (DUF983 family)
LSAASDGRSGDGTSGEDRRAPLLAVTFGSRCPRCGQGRLFQGFLTLAPRCAECGLDFAKVDTGDGPAVFVILVVGFLVVAAALITEVTYAPPYWVHVALWVPLTFVLCLGFLRPFKAALVALQFRHKAAGGQFTD